MGYMETLSAIDVHVLDWRDAPGSEHLHASDLDAQERIHGKMVVPVGISGSDLRDAGNLERILADLSGQAVKLRREWDAIDPQEPSKGRGGACRYRPVLIIVRNYGASVYAAQASRRVAYF